MDPVVYFFPQRWHAARLIAGGELPWWNRSILGGVPLFSNPQSALAYPPHWLFLLWPGGTAYTAPLLLHLGLFGAATFLLLRRVGLGMVPALAGGALCLAGNYGWSRLQFGNFMNVLPWMPVWLLAGVSFARSPRAMTFTGGTFAVALAFMAGAHQLAVYAALGLAVFAIPHLLMDRHRLRWLGFAAGSALLGGLAAAPGWLPQWAFLGETSRAVALDPETILAGTFGSWADMARVLLGPSGDAGWSASVGAFALLAAGAVPGDRTRKTFWLGAWAAAFVTLLLAWRPVVAQLLDWIPAFGAFHDPRRIVGVTQWMIILAAAAAADDWMARGRESPGRRAARLAPVVGMAALIVAAGRDSAVTTGIASALLGAAFLAVCARRRERASEKSPTAMEPAGEWRTRESLAGAILLGAPLLLAVETFRSVDIAWLPAANLTDSGPPALLRGANLRPGERFFAVDWKRDFSYDFRRPDLRDSALPNLAMIWGLEDLGGYEPARSPRYDRWLASAAPWPGDRAPWRNHFTLAYPPHPGSAAIEKLAEANLRGILLPRWGAPLYLTPLGARRAGGLAPAWPLNLDLRVLFRPGTASATERMARLITSDGGVLDVPFDPSQAEAASAPVLAGPVLMEAVGEGEADPELRSQVIRLRAPEPGASLAALELGLPAEEFPAWAFAWSDEMSRTYPARADSGLRVLCGFAPETAWAVLHAEGQKEAAGRIVSTQIGSSRLELEVVVEGEAGATLELRDTWWPGWRGWVNGTEEEIRPSGPDGNGPWRSIAVPPGRSNVVMKYEPPLLGTALLTSSSSLLALLLLGWMMDRRYSRPASGGEGESAKPSF